MRNYEPAITDEPFFPSHVTPLENNSGQTPSRGRIALTGTIAGLGLLAAGCSAEGSAPRDMEATEVAQAADEMYAGYAGPIPTTIVVARDATPSTTLVSTRSETPSTAPSEKYVTMYGQELLVPRAELTGQELLDVIAHNYEVALNYQDESVTVEKQIERALEMVRINLAQNVDPQLLESIRATFTRAHKYHRGDPFAHINVWYVLDGAASWKPGAGNKTASVSYTAHDDSVKTNLPKQMFLTQGTDSSGRKVWQVQNILLT